LAAEPSTGDNGTAGTPSDVRLQLGGSHRHTRGPHYPLRLRAPALVSAAASGDFENPRRRDSGSSRTSTTRSTPYRAVRLPGPVLGCCYERRPQRRDHVASACCGRGRAAPIHEPRPLPRCPRTPTNRIRSCISASAYEDGAFMEPSGRNQWQPVANRESPRTPETSQYRCHRLRPVAVRASW
jgi:hypothetical protein